jgi:metal-dependent HD superfamily phosphatase/phosphodiesterase
MEKGRARIPMMLATSAQVGDIHKYSANAIERVTISSGQEKPIRIHVDMTASVGFFQVEEILLRKVAASPVKPHIELFAQLRDQETKRYL